MMAALWGKQLVDRMVEPKVAVTDVQMVYYLVGQMERQLVVRKDILKAELKVATLEKLRAEK
jgi:hypothetical protein